MVIFEILFTGIPENNYVEDQVVEKSHVLFCYINEFFSLMCLRKDASMLVLSTGMDLSFIGHIKLRLVLLLHAHMLP